MDQIPDLSLQHLHFPWQSDGDFGLFAIDRADLDGDLETLLGAFSAPVSRHRFHPQKHSQPTAAMSNLEFSRECRFISAYFTGTPGKPCLISKKDGFT
jgi:hypothetical protein